MNNTDCFAYFGALFPAVRHQPFFDRTTIYFIYLYESFLRIISSYYILFFILLLYIRFKFRCVTTTCIIVTSDLL